MIINPKGRKLMQFMDIIAKYLQVIRINDLIDIIVVACLIYFLINLIKETRAMQLFKGLILLLLFF